jgi:hypothetical protein
VQTECKAGRLEFQGFGRRQVVASFDGGRISSDGGLLLLREVAQRTGLLERFAHCFTDYRDPRRIEHKVEALVAQRVLALAQGYEDLNDHDALRDDPLLALAVGKPDLTGAQRLRGRDQGHALAGKSTLNRLERTPDKLKPQERYSKIVYNAAAIETLFTDDFIRTQPQPPRGVGARPRRHRRPVAWSAGGQVLSRLLRLLLLSATVHFLWRFSALRQAAQVRS